MLVCKLQMISDGVESLLSSSSEQSV